MVTKKTIADNPTPKKRVVKKPKTPVVPESVIEIATVPEPSSEPIEVMVSLPATETSAEPKSDDRIKTPKGNNDWFVSTFFIVAVALILVIVAYGAGYTQGIADQNQNQTINGIMKTPMEYDRAQIMETEKKLMGQIMDYQVVYGSNTVSWSLNVNFR
jgi:hypothetical protein